MSKGKTPKAVLKYAVRIVTELKLREEHRSCDRKVCEYAADRWDHCKHGTYVGDWAGPDYMCGDCENGIEDHSYALGMAWARQRREVQRVFRHVLDGFYDAFDAARNDGGAGWLSEADQKALRDALRPLLLRA